MEDNKEGVVCSYVHAGSRIGVLVELNCKSDSVGKSDGLKELAKNLAMQIAATPSVTQVSPEGVDQEWLAKETEIEMGKEDLAGKKEDIKRKMVEGRIQKRLKETSLMDQEYIRDSTLSVATLVKNTSATLGETITVRRFTRYNLGEGLQKKTNDFAAEVAQATGGLGGPSK